MLKTTYYQTPEALDYLPKRSERPEILGRLSAGATYVSSFLKKRYYSSSFFLRYRKRRPRIKTFDRNCGYCGSSNTPSPRFGARRVIAAHCQNCGAVA